RLTRSNVPNEQTWDLTDLFISDEAWNKALSAIEANITKVTKFKGQLAKSSETLLECLTTFYDHEQQVIRVATYAMLKSQADGTDPNNQRDFSRVQAVIAKINAELSFFESELLTIPSDIIQQFLQENASLKTYEKMLTDLLEEKPYTLTAELEKTLAALSEVHGAPYMIYGRSKSSDMQFEAIHDQNGN